MDLRMLIPIFGILLVMIPVAGITFALTLRFAVRPFVETLASALRDSGALGGADREEIAALVRSVEGLESEVARLREEHAFDRELLAPPRSVRPGGTGGEPEGSDTRTPAAPGHMEE